MLAVELRRFSGVVGGKLLHGGRFDDCPRRLYSISLPHARKTRFENGGGFASLGGVVLQKGRFARVLGLVGRGRWCGSMKGV